MKIFYIIGAFLILQNISVMAQKDRRLIREGVREYNKEKYGEAEISFKQALDQNEKSFPADYNVANSLYKQNKYKEAAEKYDLLSKKDAGKENLADVYHNLGNSFLEEKQYEKSIDAYKNSLKLRPQDEATRYNLAYAQAMLKKQQQQQDQKDNDQKDNKDKKDQDKKDDQKKDENKDQEKKNDQEQDEKNKDQEKDQNEQQPENELTKQEVEQILEAIQNQEKDVKEKVEKEKARTGKASLQKDW